ncbi:MAG: hypothetical protein Q7T20_10950 [Saprospiraceae bacterium]|nr:hypothetical protein [Saprospiraceae bacterium]
MQNPVQIIIIDDNFRSNDPLMVDLQEKYGDSNVQIFRRPNEGIKYVLDHLSSKIVVLLDMDLGTSEKRGDAVFAEIQEKTLLVTVIIMSAKLQSLSNEELRGFINNHAFSAIDSNASVKTNLPIINKAVNQLSLRVDCALEEWILRHSPEDRDKPYLTLIGGEKYSLNQILAEIRKNTELGLSLQKKILNLTVELLARQKEKLAET